MAIVAIKTAFSKSVTAYCKHLGDAEKPYFVMDSAGYSADNLKTMEDVLWLTRVPETLAEAQRLVRETAEALETAKKSLGKFIIATNQLDAERLSAQAMLEHYTAQGVSVERGFRFLKDPLFFAHSLFRELVAVLVSRVQNKVFSTE